MLDEEVALVSPVVLIVQSTSLSLSSLCSTVVGAAEVWSSTGTLGPSLSSSSDDNEPIVIWICSEI